MLDFCFSKFKNLDLKNVAYTFWVTPAHIQVSGRLLQSECRARRRVLTCLWPGMTHIVKKWRYFPFMWAPYWNLVTVWHFYQDFCLIGRIFFMESMYKSFIKSMRKRWFHLEFIMVSESHVYCHWALFLILNHVPGLWYILLSIYFEKRHK